MTKRRNLTYTQRLQIETLNNAKKTKKEIAEILGLHLCTIYRELKRGAYNRLNGATWETFVSYSAQISQDRYDNLCSGKGRPIKLGKDWAFVNYIEQRVTKDKISACAVLGEIKYKQLPFETQISKTTLYRYIQLGYFPNIRLEKRKKEYKKVKIKRAPKGTSIERRPKEIKDRQSFGHWEMDCVCGKTKSVLLVLSERLTRKEIIFKMENQKALSVVRCLNILERRFGKQFKKIFKTITVDNGSEFADYIGMEKSSYGHGKRTSLYYCHPYCSSERGTNERLNREIRRLIPKGSDISKYTVQDIQKVEDWVNNYPREIFNYATSAELFEQHLQAIA